MIILKIKEKGLYIEIPGITPFRTPAEVNITHVSIPLVASKLQSQGIFKYEIISDTKGKEKKYTNKDFVKKKRIENSPEERISALENLILNLIDKIPSNQNNNEEQINKKLDQIEKLIKKQPKQKIVKWTPDPEFITKDKDVIKKNSNLKTNPEIEEIFIPTVNVDVMKIKGDSSKITTEQDNADIDEAADLLSQIGKRK